jgi:diketogulonate reductase-like aldo/keto reductase
LRTARIIQRGCDAPISMPAGLSLTIILDRDQGVGGRQRLVREPSRQHHRQLDMTTSSDLEPTGKRTPTGLAAGAMPRLGVGTWHMGESASAARREVAALRAAFEMGYRLVDTAEMYASGGAESVVGEALRGALRDGVARREEFHVVSKVLPSNADAKGVVAACERSLARLELDALDLYLLHWRGGVPLRATLEGFETLRSRGLIKRWGVSNFDVDDLRELASLPTGRDCATNQVWYSLGQRGPGFELLPTMQRAGMTLMAYCPLDEGRLVRHAGLRAFAEGRGATPAQVALAWLMDQPGVSAIPKSSSIDRLRENHASLELALSAQDRVRLDALFQPPRRASSLAMV